MNFPRDIPTAERVNIAIKYATLERRGSNKTARESQDFQDNLFISLEYIDLR